MTGYEEMLRNERYSKMHRDLGRSIWMLKKGRLSYVDPELLETILKLHPELKEKLVNDRRAYISPRWKRAVIKLFPELESSF